MTFTPEATETQSLLECQRTDYKEPPRSWSTPKKAAILGVVSFAVFNEYAATCAREDSLLIKPHEQCCWNRRRHPRRNSDRP